MKRLRWAIRSIGGEAIIKKAHRILDRILVVRVHSTRRFIVKDHFQVNINSPYRSKVHINYVNDKFNEHFSRKVDDNVPAAELTVHTLTKDYQTFPLLEIPGSHVDTYLAHVWELISRQGNGQKGDLLTNSDPNAVGNANDNIFFILDDRGERLLVSVFWSAHHGGWMVNAYSAEQISRWVQPGWLAGCRVFSF